MNAVARPSQVHPAAAAATLLVPSLWLLALANVFDMGGGFGVKYVSYVVVAAVLALRWSDYSISPLRLAVPLLLLVIWPLVAVAVGLARGADAGDAIGEATPFLPGVLAFLLIQGAPGRSLLDVVMDSIALLAVATIGLFMLLLVAPGSAPATAALALLGDEAHGFFGVRTLGPVSVPNVYFKATLFMVPAFAWFLFRHRYLKAALCALGLVLAFSRAGVALVAVLGAFFLLTGSLRQQLLAGLLIAAVGLLLARHGELLQLAEYGARLQDALLGRDLSAQARIGHLGSLAELLNRDAWSLWLGHGAGTAFYSAGTGAWVTFIELDHVDAIRQFGLAWFAVFTMLVGFVGHRVYRAGPDGRAAAIALGAAFVASGTNPVLINPLFMILLAALAHYGDNADADRAD
ncbi:MAG: hypothetical protein EHM60_03590 [Lysobacterales bacterium]|nr:MAG: hypothetical protein EHM60_03590 [Xanthomonadales bacterium]